MMNKSATIAPTATMTRIDTYAHTGTEEEVLQPLYAQDDWAWTVPAFGNSPATRTTASIAMPNTSGTMREAFRFGTEIGRTGRPP